MLTMYIGHISRDVTCTG